MFLRGFYGMVGYLPFPFLDNIAQWEKIHICIHFDPFTTSMSPFDGS